MGRNLLAFVLWIGVAVFFVAVGGSIYFYPGGNRFDYQFGRFSFFENFLCDLFAKTAYNGSPNPGRPYALLGVYSLAVALFAYWQLIPRLFANRRTHGRCTRILGTLAMALMLLIATPLHDLCITIGAPLGFIAFISATHAFMKNRETTLARLGVLAIGTCIASYLSFVFRVFPRSLPVIQKAALLSFLVCVVAGMLRLTLAVQKKGKATLTATGVCR